MNIVVPYQVFSNLFNWNIMYIKNNSHEYFKINYSDDGCILENVYIRVPDIKSFPDDFKDFMNKFEDFKEAIFNRCRATLVPTASITDTYDSYKFTTANTIETTNTPKMIRINNVRINDNVISLNYDNIY